MAVNLATKYAEKIQQKFTAGSLVDGRLSNDYSFVGAKTVVVSTISTVPVNDYARTASANRYGTPAEVEDTKQELTMSQDKSFTGIIDKGNTKDQTFNKAGKFLSVQISEVITPMMDKYKREKLAAGAGTTKTDVAITASNVSARMSAPPKALLATRLARLFLRTPQRIRCEPGGESPALLWFARHLQDAPFPARLDLARNADLGQ